MIISIISVFIIVKVIFLHSKPMKAVFLRQLSNHEVHFLLPSMDEYRRNFSFCLCTACIALQIKNVYRWATASGGCTEYKDALTRDGNRKRADIRRRNELRGLYLPCGETHSRVSSRFELSHEESDTRAAA